MDPLRALALSLDPSLILKAQGLDPDPWQRDLLLSPDRQVLLNCSRQSGKSTTVAALALHTALFQPGSLVLILSRAIRQAHELFRKVLDAYNALGRPVPPVQDATTLSKLELQNGSRIIGLPGKEDTIRSFSKVALLLIDEAARVPDDVYRSVRPMLAVSGGRLIALSTPFGQRGWFWHEWEHGHPWRKIKITWHDCPRITHAFIAQERASMGDAWVQQEYECCFGSLEGLVYPDFDQCLVDMYLPTGGKLVGGIDFGWRNPFAALWGTLDRDDVLWILRERYLRETPLHEHVLALKARAPGTMWYADPAGRTEIEEMRSADLKVRQGNNDLRAGIAAVTARYRSGRLKVLSTHCPNLIAEARLYRYPGRDERTSARALELPVDDNNHALGALRYLISRLDARFMARFRKKAGAYDGPLEDYQQEEIQARTQEARARTGSKERWNTLDNPAVWDTL